MSTIVNDRDIGLQATSPRLVEVTLPANIIIPAVKSLALSAPSLTFQVTTAGVASPAAILFTATLKQIAGTVAFSVIAGTATLTGTGNARALTYANLGSDSATVRASVTENAITYTSELTISKVRDGAIGTDGTDGTTTYTWVAYANNATGTAGFTTGANTGQTYIGIATNKTTATESTTPSDYTWSLIKGTDGSNGSPGTRGTRQLYLTSASYTASYGTANYASAATAAIAAAVAGSTPTTPIKGDAVTFTNASNYAWTIAYSGSAWVTPGTVIDGGLLVPETVTAGALVTGSAVITGTLQLGDDIVTVPTQGTTDTNTTLTTTPQTFASATFNTGPVAPKSVFVMGTIAFTPPTSGASTSFENVSLQLLRTNGGTIIQVVQAYFSVYGNMFMIAPLPFTDTATLLPNTSYTYSIRCTRMGAPTSISPAPIVDGSSIYVQGTKR